MIEAIWAHKKKIQEGSEKQEGQCRVGKGIPDVYE